ncbi:MAG: restriction endonuclease [Burkholderiaceae bacterium]|nr:restriction endonuclease [Burkholderiaceae bacterium]
MLKLMSATSLELNALRDALLDLPSSGQSGFEGLLATVFAKILGVPFRLAKSGSQFGVDGKASDSAFPVAFEAKRYRNDVPSTEVLNKLGALAIREDPVELWILGTTGIVSSQVADDLSALAKIHGFSTLILDWQPGAASLAAVLAEASAEVIEFLHLNVKAKGLAEKAISELEIIVGREDLESIAKSVLHQLRAASVATPMAQEANQRWLYETLSNRMRAKSRLGQALTPLETGGALILARRNLKDKLASALKDAREGELVAVLGDEGNGKSWLAIDGCIGLPSKPLVIVFSPEEFGAIPEGVNWDEVLAQKLLTQTGESNAGFLTARWRRRFERWRSAEVPSTPRLLVFIDGLNQRPAVTWGRHIDGLALHTYELGGRLLVTSRSEYFQRHVEPRLMSPVVQIVVPPWTEFERDQILAEKGMVGAKLHPSVASALLNPRLLGIALMLLDADTLENMEALSVTWLLFEHLRLLDRERSNDHSAREFAATLQRHARDILVRVRSKVVDDLTIFENLEPAAEGHFFQWVTGDPHRYTLRDHGLTYALGLAIIEELRAAVRNDKDVGEALQTVLEPIAALDQTANATIAALTVACLDQQISESLCTALMVGVAQLQNPGAELDVSIGGLARRRVRALCEACELLWMAPNPAPNADCLEASLHFIKHYPDAWADIQPFLGKWLRYWWPDIRVDYKVQNTHRSQADERRDAEAERDQRTTNLNEIEREYLSQLIPQQVSPYRLIQLAIEVCAQMPLELLVNGLACASFSFALTPTHYSPIDALSSLIRFNRRDWSAARVQLLTNVAQLASSGASLSGKWAAVTLLRATGVVEDSSTGHKLFLELTKDRERFESWRLVESYCATDPCDPSSERPANIETTARKYEQLNVGELKLFMGPNEHDHFVESALPGLARFAPNIIVQKHREFLAAIPSRRGLPLRQATWGALDDAALISDSLASVMLTLSISLAHDPNGVDKDSVPHVQQSLLLAIFPRISPREQLAGADAIPNPNHIWLELLGRAKEGVRSQLLEIARLRGPTDLRAAVPLALAGNTTREPLPELASMMQELLRSPHMFVRVAALHLATVSGDREALKALVESGWTSKKLLRSSRERIAGSLALIEAARRELVAASEIFPRIAAETYGAACTQLDDASIEHLAGMLDACVRTASAFNVSAPPVGIVRTVMHDDEAEKSSYSLEEISKESMSTLEELNCQDDEESRFYARRRKIHECYETFEKQLSVETATIVLEAFRVKEIQAILRVAPNMIYGWSKLLRDINPSCRRALRNFGIYVGCALTHSVKHSEGVALLTHLYADTSYVKVRYTRAGFRLEAMAFWWASDSAEIERLRFSRLDACANDHEIALETAAALYAEKSAVLRAYVQDRLGSPLPVDIARAIMVAGFSNDACLAKEVIENLHGREGLLATAAQSSRYAMDRYQWSKHWFEQMLNSCTEEDFWTASILFLKVVDARFDAELRGKPVGSEVFNTWWWSVKRRLSRRFEKWAEKREKTLFGSKAPDSIFLSQQRWNTSAFDQHSDSTFSSVEC